MNININEIGIGNSISANLYGAVNGSASFSGVILSHLTSDGLPSNSTAPTDHVNIYRDLPQTVKDEIFDDYMSYSYYMVKLADDNIIYIGAPWMIAGTVVKTIVTTAVINLDEFDDIDGNAVTALLRENGYKVSSIIINT
jgi:hypothetical protein